MTADPKPFLRCRCVSWDANGGWQDDYHQRCHARPDAEDGLCSHYRQPGPCADLGCVDMDGTRGFGCCLGTYAARTFVDLTNPCRALDAAPF